MGISTNGKHEQLGTIATQHFRKQLRGVEPSRSVATLLAVFASDTGLQTIRTGLRGLECELIEATSISQVSDILSRHSVDLILLDLTAAQPAAFHLCQLLKSDPATQLLPVYALGSSNDQETEIRALEAGADEFIVSPLRPRPFQARIHASLRHKGMVDSLDDSEAVLFSLAQSVEDRDPDLGQHCHRLALMGAAMGVTLGLPARDILALQRGGYLHDIGKVAVPDTVLFKPGPLTSDEWNTMKTHAARGERICGGMKSLSSVLPIIRSHHERWDGSGYPDGLKGEEIPLLARVLQLADIYDALTTARPYKSALTPEQALATIREEVCKGWRDPKLVELFADVLPMFRTAPMATDHSHFSLHALASTVDRFRESASRLDLGAVPGDSSQGLKLVSGF